MKTNKALLLVLGLTSFTLLSGLALSSSSVAADDDSVIDEVNIVVPTSCTMSGTGMQSHTATINNGTYASDIGTTTFDVYCNDKDGFAVYAIGYTDDTDGKNVLTSSTLGSTQDIVTGTNTSGNSQWAMKLTTDANATYPLTLQNGYGAYHTVPDDYELVAKRTASTDIGAAATGSSFTSTYQVFISSTQLAGTYLGQVKYVMVHPNTAPQPVGENQIGVIYDGNGLFFDQAGTQSTNRVVYEETCEDEYGYIADTPTVIKTNNISNDGTQNGSYNGGDNYFECYDGSCLNQSHVYFEGASRLKITARYGLSFNQNGEAGYSLSLYAEDYEFYIKGDSDGDQSGTFKEIINGNEIDIEMGAWGATKTGYDYGLYIQIYPIYNEPTQGASYDLVEEDVCKYRPVSGAYVETTPWNDYWYSKEDGAEFYYETVDEYNYDDYGIVRYITYFEEDFIGNTITVYAYNPYKIYYDGNGATAGTMSGFYTGLRTNASDSTADLMAYNFKKTGYGFAGWSANSNATVNSNSRIYGPNEKIAGNELTFDSNQETTLYAVWVPSAGNLQNWSGCSGMNIGQVTALTDTRDNNVYTVAKLADGNCWMMENLRLDAANSSDSSKAQGFGGAFVGLANSEDSTFGSTTANNIYSLSNITGNNQSRRFPRYNSNNTNIGGTNSSGVTLIPSPGKWDGSHFNPVQSQNGSYGDKYQWYGYGNHYSWAAAMANTTNMPDASTSEVANTSICPLGWVLPYSGISGSGISSGGFSYLDAQMGGTGQDQYTEIASNRWRGYPSNFVYSGLLQAWGSMYGRGDFASYWSRTSSNDALNLQLDNDSIIPSAHTMKEHGATMRCLIIDSN